jgi:hypothetical protein
MSSENAEGGLTSEHVLLVVMLVIASYMFVESFTFGRSTAFFPRLTSGVTVLGASLLLVRDYLPGPLQEYVAESTDMMSGYSPDGAEEDEATDWDPSRGRPIPASAFTVFALVAYVLGAYYVGLLWVTPGLVFVYTSWFRLGWISRIAVSVAGMGIVYVFMIVMNVDFAQGFLV